MRKIASGGRRLRPGAWLAVAAALMTATASARAVTVTTAPAPLPVAPALPALPPASTYPIQLILDDDSAESSFGVLSGNGAKQFLWFNRFTVPGPMELDQVWVLFPSGPNMVVGQPVQLVVYQDTDGNPANGATLLGTFDVTIQATDDVTFSVYTLPTPLQVTGGDVLIGVVDRFVSSGITSPTNPAALDTTASQGRSFYATWAGYPPASPDLATASQVTLVDSTVTGGGNWMIRGFGRALPVTVVPALDWRGLGALALLLGAAGAFLLYRRT